MLIRRRGLGGRPAWFLSVLFSVALLEQACGSSDSCEETRSCGSEKKDAGSDSAAPDGGNDATADGSDGSPTDAALGDFSISSAPGPVTLTVGNSNEVTVSVARTNGSSESLVVSAEGLPPGVTSTSAIAGANDASVTLTLTATLAALQGSKDITVAATGVSSGLTRNATTSLFVRGRPGSLDTTFGKQGYVEAHAGGVDSYSRDLSIGADDTIVLVGWVGVGPVGATTPNGTALAKLTPDGTPDSSFGGSGTIHEPIADGDHGYAITSQGAKGLVVFSQTKAAAGGVLRRYLGNGSIDTSFGSGGVASLPAATKGFTARNLLQQSDGKLIAVGVALNASNDWNFAAMRLTADGQVDTSFGTGGLVLVPGGACASADDARVHSNGSIMVVGESHDCYDPQSFQPFMVKLTPAGALDSNFGTQGKSLLFAPTSGRAHSFLFEPPSSFIVLTGKGIGTLSLVDSAGKDTQTIGDFGSVTFPQNATHLLRQNDNKILAVGTVGEHVLMTRFLPDFKLDTTFGEGGQKVVSTGALLMYGVRVGFQKDGRIIVAGTKWIPPYTAPTIRMWAARFWN